MPSPELPVCRSSQNGDAATPSVPVGRHSLMYSVSLPSNCRLPFELAFADV